MVTTLSCQTNYRHVWFAQTWQSLFKPAHSWNNKYIKEPTKCLSTNSAKWRKHKAWNHRSRDTTYGNTFTSHRVDNCRFCHTLTNIHWTSSKRPKLFYSNMNFLLPLLSCIQSIFPLLPATFIHKIINNFLKGYRNLLHMFPALQLVIGGIDVNTVTLPWFCWLKWIKGRVSHANGHKKLKLLLHMS